MASVAPQTTRRLLSYGLLWALLVLGLAGVGLNGCSGGKKLSASGTSGELPDGEVEDFSVTETDSGKPQWTLFAKHAATYQARDLVTARTLRIDFFDDKGVKSSELVAREGELYQRTRDMIARGNVVLLTTEGWRMSTDEMHFLNSHRKITSDKLVRVEKEGTVLEGVGFESDPGLEHFEFRHQIRATVQPGAGALAAPKQEKK
ncbi:MAG TPA: LPS export ABC transporter periplasmic protein LptC [Methylomirabilota bacterium]|jgi:LPS export ABC transporter protein LptC|nr:LPS export ABC transporter periplasmic protein LptC [Methylomirabilota bacterium]